MKDRISLVCCITALLHGCVPDVSLQDNVAIKVQLLFTGFHDDVSASWNGSMTGSFFTNAGFGDTSASQTFPDIGEVVPPATIDFPVRENIFPGLWEIQVSVFDGGTEIVSAQCSNLDIGNNRVLLGGVYTVQVFENGVCTAELGDISPPPPPARDAEAVSIAVPGSATIGDLLQIPVGVRNNGETLQENISVDLSYRPPGGSGQVSIDSQSTFVNPLASGNVTFDWDTACLPSQGDYLLEASVSIPDDSVANNSQVGAVNLSRDRELALANFQGPANITVGAPGGAAFFVDISNGRSQAESGISVSVSDSFSSPGTIQQLWVNPLELDCGETEELAFVYFPSTLSSPPESGNLTVSIDTTIPGDSPTDNQVSRSLNLQP